jgi:hypothetical protein
LNLTASPGLGSAPVCRFDPAANGTATVRLSPDTTLTPAQSVEIWMSVFDDQANVVGANQITASFTIATPSASAMRPVLAAVSAPSRISVCDALTLDATASTGALARPFSAVQWSVVAMIPPQPSWLTVGLLQFLAAKSANGDMVVNIPTEFLVPGVAYQFGVVLTNWMGSVSPQTLTRVTKSLDPVLPIYLSGPAYLWMTPDEPINLQASSVRTLQSSCFNTSLISALTFSLQWTQLASLPASYSLPSGPQRFFGQNYTVPFSSAAVSASTVC